MNIWEEELMIAAISEDGNISAKVFKRADGWHYEIAGGIYGPVKTEDRAILNAVKSIRRLRLAFTVLTEPQE